MKIKPWRLLALLFMGLLCGLILLVVYGEEAGKANVLKLGISNGAPEVLSKHISSNYDLPLEAESVLEVHSIVDCCNNQSQMALSAGEVDMAVLCRYAALNLVERDERYRVIDTWISGSDVLVLRSDALPRKVAYASGRDYQKEMARSAAGQEAELVPMIPSAIPYALERGSVDAGIMDICRACELPERFLIQALEPASGNCYVLVARKDLAGSPAFISFMEAWRQSAVDLQDSELLGAAIASVQNTNSERKEGEKWSQINVKIPIPE